MFNDNAVFAGTTLSRGGKEEGLMAEKGDMASCLVFETELPGTVTHNTIKLIASEISLWHGAAWGFQPGSCSDVGAEGKPHDPPVLIVYSVGQPSPQSCLTASYWVPEQSGAWNHLLLRDLIQAWQTPLADTISDPSSKGSCSSSSSNLGEHTLSLQAAIFVFIIAGTSHLIFV